MSKIEINVSTKEANRQMLIIEELKKNIQKQKERLGRPLFYTAITFGCAYVTAVGILKPLSIKCSYKRTFALNHF